MNSSKYSFIGIVELYFKTMNSNNKGFSKKKKQEMIFCQKQSLNSEWSEFKDLSRINYLRYRDETTCKTFLIPFSLPPFNLINLGVVKKMDLYFRSSYFKSVSALPECSSDFNHLFLIFSSLYIPFFYLFYETWVS